MEIFLNAAGEITCGTPGHESTVADLIMAMERFCLANIDCSLCTNTCCSGFIVYADNIFIRNVRALLSCEGTSAAADLMFELLRRDPHSRKWYIPQKADGKCIFLAPDGKCLIYQARPLVCRLHVCRKHESGFRKLKDDIYYAYQQALKLETAAPANPATLGPGPENFLVGMDSYEAKILDVVGWTQASQHNGFR